MRLPRQLRTILFLCLSLPAAATCAFWESAGLPQTGAISGRELKAELSLAFTRGYILGIAVFGGVPAELQDELLANALAGGPVAARLTGIPDEIEFTEGSARACLATLETVGTAWVFFEIQHQCEKIAGRCAVTAGALELTVKDSLGPATLTRGLCALEPTGDFIHLGPLNL